MTRLLDREGTFRAVPLSWGLQDSKASQSIALAITYRILAQRDGDDWHDWRDYEDHEITGYHYIVKANGDVNTATVESLVKAGIWDGNPDLNRMGPPDVACQIVVEPDVYNGKTKLKVNWVNHVDYTGGVKSVDEVKIKEISMQYGSQFRAIAAQAKPVAAAAKPKPAPPAAPARQPIPDDDPLSWMNDDPPTTEDQGR